MKLDKTLQNLKQLHEDYSEEVRVLTEKINRLQINLQTATEKMLQTFEAIQVLENKPSLGDILNKTSEQLENAAANETRKAILALPDATPSPQNGNLPAPEPGFQWAKSKNELGDLIDVLVPLAHPSETNNTRIDIPLPPIGGYDSFADPSSFIEYFNSTSISPRGAGD